MYKVMIDGVHTLYYPGDEACTISDPELHLQISDSGSFTCGVPAGNPCYSLIKNRSTMITVIKNNREIFCGEVRESEKGFYGEKEIYAVGELAFLFDSIQPKAVYHDKTPRQLLEMWIGIHNGQVEGKKRFYVGMVTVTDSNDSLYRYTNQETTLDCIREKICDRLNGKIRIRKENGKRYIDIVTMQEYGNLCSQPITFGENLLDYSEGVSASDLYTCIIPRGARLEESPIEGLEAYLDIKSVNDGKDYLFDQTAVEQYGWNRRVVTWDDVTLPENLKKKGQQWLKDNQFEKMVLSVTAYDLSHSDVKMESIFLGDRIRVLSPPHGMDRIFPVQKITLHLENPENDRLEMGDAITLSYTSQSSAAYQKIEGQMQQNASWMQAAIGNATAMMTGSRGGYKVSEYDEDGRWIRDLYMDAPSKEQARQVMQVSMAGIGFSQDGFEGPYKNAWTIDGVLLGEFIKAGSVTAEKLSVEYRKSVEDEIDTRFYVADGRIEAEVKRAKEEESALSLSIDAANEAIELRVKKGEIGSYMEQYYDRVIYGFNHSSKYVQINPGEIAIYDNGVEDSKKRSVFDEDGEHFYRDGYYIGKIGTNRIASDETKKGLVFDLEADAAYMTWAARESAADKNYTIKLLYAEKSFNGYVADTLNAFCDFDMHNYTVKNLKVSNLQAGGYLGWTGEIPIVTDLIRDTDGTITGWRYGSINVATGVITSAPAK